MANGDPFGAGTVYPVDRLTKRFIFLFPSLGVRAGDNRTGTPKTYFEKEKKS